METFLCFCLSESTSIYVLTVGCYLVVVVVCYSIPYPIRSMMDGRSAVMDEWSSIHEEWMEEKNGDPGNRIGSGRPSVGHTGWPKMAS